MCYSLKVWLIHCVLLPIFYKNFLFFCIHHHNTKTWIGHYFVKSFSQLTSIKINISWGVFLRSYTRLLFSIPTNRFIRFLTFKLLKCAYTSNLMSCTTLSWKRLKMCSNNCVEIVWKGRYEVYKVDRFLHFT